MTPKLSHTDSQALYFVKAVAIFSAVAAHASVIDTSTRASTVITCLWDIFSSLSIGSFLITGGILYSRAPGDTLRFWKHKAVTLLLPWVFCSGLTYIYRGLNGHGLGLWGYVNWMLGNGTWYYYATIYVVMLALFKPIWQRPPALWGCVGVNVLVLTGRAFGIHPFSWLPFSEYLNIFNWFGFFALGILLRRNGLKLGPRTVPWCAAAFLLAFAYVYRHGIFNYFHIANTLYSAFGFFLLFALGRKLADSWMMPFFREMGATTYCVYLLHMPIVQAVGRKIPVTFFHHLFIPVIGMGVMLVLIQCGKWITTRLPHGKFLRMLVGLR